MSNPNSVSALRGLSFYYGSMGFPEQESPRLCRTRSGWTLAFVDLNNLAARYTLRGRYADAASAANDALALRPDRKLTLYTLCSAYAGMKKVRDAQILIGRLLALDEPGASRGCALENAVAMATSAKRSAGGRARETVFRFLRRRNRYRKLLSGRRRYHESARLVRARLRQARPESFCAPLLRSDPGFAQERGGLDSAKTASGSARVAGGARQSGSKTDGRMNSRCRCAGEGPHTVKKTGLPGEAARSKAQASPASRATPGSLRSAVASRRLVGGDGLEPPTLSV